MVDLSGNKISNRQIKVYGIRGNFTVMRGKAGLPVSVHYFQTLAANNLSSKSGNSLDLLKELKPMRERVKTSDLKDLRSLLQRDLSDYRIASDLVPYLRGDKSTVGFFPSILVALLPKGFLTEDAGISYPEPDNTVNLKTTFGEYWGTESLTIASEETSLAVLSVNPELTDFIVLDGQHRANAFRYLAGTFEEATNKGNLYSVFYQDCMEPDPKSFSAELPVTIVWFEAEDKIEPSLISRRLFVDVNTNARKVSDSRNILLNDNELAAVCTTNFYTYLAKLGYETEKLSLLHSGFDCEGDFPSDFPKMTIFSPKTFHYMLSYFLVSNIEYSSLSKTIHREQYGGNLGQNLGRFKDFTKAKDNQINKMLAGDSKALIDVDELVTNKVSPKIYRILNELEFLQVHYKACQQISEQIDDEGGPTDTDVWTKVFVGGEGLYNAFQEIEREEDGKLTGKLGKCMKSVKSIDADFATLRSKNHKQYNKAFQTFTSQAGFTGFFMALLRVSENDAKGWSDTTITKFIKAANKISIKCWTEILTTYKQVIIPESSPKLWTYHRLIFLRFLQEHGGWTFFDKTHVQDYHPDLLFCKRILSRKISSYIDEKEKKPTQTMKEKWVMESLRELDSCLKKIKTKKYYSDKKLTAALQIHTNLEIERLMG